MAKAEGHKRGFGSKEAHGSGQEDDPVPASPVVSQTTIQDKPLSVPEKVKIFFKTLYKIVSSSLGLLIILIAYSFAGAGIFHAIEGGHESREKREVNNALYELLDSAWNITQNGRNETEFKMLLREKMVGYEGQLRTAFLHGVTSDTEVEVWDFWGAFLFCATVYTTIGYGHIAPATKWGRVATMVYALLGIPLCLVVMASLGKLFTRAIKFLWSFIRRFYHTGQCRKVRKTGAKPVVAAMEKISGHHKVQSHDEGSSDEHDEAQADETQVFQVDDEFNLPPIIAIAITVAYIFVGAVMYSRWEQWDYLEAFYFIFISISTVGFGDVLPEHPRYFLASSIYILIGLSLVAMVINVIMEVVNSTITKAKDKMINVGQRMGISASAVSVNVASRTSADSTTEGKQK